MKCYGKLEPHVTVICQELFWSFIMVITKSTAILYSLINNIPFAAGRVGNIGYILDLYALMSNTTVLETKW